MEKSEKCLTSTTRQMNNKKHTANLYLIYQDTHKYYNFYDSAVVAADSEDDARSIHPDGYKRIGNKWAIRRKDGTYFFEESLTDDQWCAPSEVKATLIGQTSTEEAGAIVCSSFNGS